MTLSPPGLLPYGYAERRPIVSVDVVLFTMSASTRRLQVALVPRRTEPLAGVPAIPGTYVHEDDDADLEASAGRALRVKCGLDVSRVRGAWLEQLRAFSGAARDPRGWSVTVGFWALVEDGFFAQEGAVPGIELADVDAVVSGERPLPFDHADIVREALARLRSKSTYSTLPFKLLPERFTMAEVASVYGVVLGRDVDTPNLRRWATGIAGPDGAPFLREVGRERRSTRPSAVYEASTPDLVYFQQRF